MAKSEYKLRKYSVKKAAKIVLSQCLKKVRCQLKLAAKKADEDVEHVHRLRVSTRRAIAALTVFRDVLPKIPRAKLAKQLKKIRRVAGDARDLDVWIATQLVESPSSKDLLKRLRQDRSKAQSPIVKTYKRLGPTKILRDNCRDLIKGISHADQSDSQVFSTWSKKQLAKQVSTYFDQPHPTVSNYKNLHRFRIATKKFRYTLSILKRGFRRNSFSKFLPVINRLQDVLGEINDHHTSISRIEMMEADGLTFDDDIKQSKDHGLDKATRKFEKWWTKKESRLLRKKFEKVLSKHHFR